MEHIDPIENSRNLAEATVVPEWTPPPPPPAILAAPAPFLWENPTWGFPAAIGVWVASVGLLLLMSVLFLIPFVMQYLSRKIPLDQMGQLILTDRQALVWQVIAALPAHALTLLLIWAVVTRLGKQPFWRSVKWSWGDRRDLVAIGGGMLAAVGLLGLSVLIRNKIGGGDTIIDKLIESSTAAKYSIAFLAAVSAPLVEELIYRGVLYPATQRGLVRVSSYLLPDPRHRESIQIGGAILAVLFVAVLFAGVHVDQYRNNLGVISAIALLSLVLTGARAITGRVLPSFMIHLTFNGIQALILIFVKDLDQKPVPPAPNAAALVHFLHHLPFIS